MTARARPGPTVSADTGKQTGRLPNRLHRPVRACDSRPGPRRAFGHDHLFADKTKTTLGSVPITAHGEAVIPQTVLAGRIIAPRTGGTVTLRAPAATVGADADGSWRIVLALDQKSARATVTATVPGQPSQKRQVQIKPGKTVPVAPFVFSS